MSTFDHYYCAALTGLLSNPDILKILASQSINDEAGEGAACRVVDLALDYASIMMGRKAARENPLPKPS